MAHLSYLAKFTDAAAAAAGEVEIAATGARGRAGGGMPAVGRRGSRFDGDVAR